MGIVWKAKQIGLNRIVALKMIVDGVQFHEPERLRFLAEAEAVAAIRHPNVVQVYEFGEAHGVPFFAMEFVNGGSLASVLAESGPMTPHTAAKLVAQLARGIQASHDVGVVHRDLKPANILLNQTDETRCEEGTGFHEPFALPNATGETTDTSLLQPKITDFGIAKRSNGVDLTLPGMVIGTPAYMAPEQAAGNTKYVGTGADIYALGVILFECLTGRKPFECQESQALLLQVVRDDAPAARSVSARVPRDLDLICARCLAKAPHERYPSAAALATDLEHFINGEPVSVRPAGLLERAVKWARKYPTRAVAFALTFLVVVLGLFSAGAIELWRQTDRARSLAETAQLNSETHRETAESSRRTAEEALKKAEQARKELEEAHQETVNALNHESQARAREETIRKELIALKAASEIDLAYREYEAANVDQARKLLDDCPKAYRQWEWHYLDHLCRRAVAVIETKSPKALGVTFTPDTGALLTTVNAGVQEHNLRTGAVERTLQSDAYFLTVSRDGKRVAALREAGAVAFERDTGERIKSVPEVARTASFNADGDRVLLCGSGARVWDVDAGSVTRLATEDLYVWCGAFAPDGKTVAVGGQGRSAKYTTGVVKVWKPGGDSYVILVSGEAPVWSLAIDPTGRLIACGCLDGSVTLHELATGRRVTRLWGHTRTVTSIAFDPSGKRLATVSADRSLRVWDVETWVQSLLMRGHAMGIVAVAFSPDGKRIATSGMDRTTRVWDLDLPTEAVRLTGFFPKHEVYLANESLPARAVQWIATTNDASQIVLSLPTVPARTFDARTGTVTGPQFELPNGTSVRQSGFDGRLLTTVLSSGEVHSWDFQTGERQKLEKKLNTPSPESVSADLSRVAVVDKKKWTVAILDGTTGESIATTGAHQLQTRPPTFSRDGRLLVTVGYDRQAVVWESGTGKKLFELAGHVGNIHAVAVSPDGKRIATGGEEGFIRLWDATSGQSVVTFRGPYPPVRAVGWSPDGSKLVALDENGIAHVFDGGSDLH
jgi:WD40 repeat protein